MLLHSLKIKNSQIQNVIESYRIIFCIKSIDTVSNDELNSSNGYKTSTVLVYKNKYKKRKGFKIKKKLKKNKRRYFAYQ